MYVIINSRKNKGEALKEHILKDIVPCGFDAMIEETQEKHRQAIEEEDAVTALLNDELKSHGYENNNLQVELREKDQQIAALKKRYGSYLSYLANKYKNNGITIIAKSN